MKPPFWLTVRLAGVVAFFGVIWYQCRLLGAEGQTIGKRACHLRVVRVDSGENGGFKTNVVMRAGLGTVVLSLIPLYGLIDTLFIFRADRRCLHDMIAGTRVVSIPA